ncbi:probable receptor-like protein kinase At5g24010 [Olea europaea var. sylvestris]|uniref:probable receptor-like protein kinase At5g24010 n=1 Tax=Olea europaea var. sylvestris TaxID=158386 RepID=UPI000C1D7658|nr:probable receptor-like protein kinase At5g24010 [Olea europaea var. sylvestris]
MAIRIVIMNFFLKFTFSFYTYLSLVSAFSPLDHYLINCGSADPVATDLYRRIFKGDSVSGHLVSIRASRVFNADPSSYSSCGLYRTARAFNRPLHYAFPIKDPGTHHLVRLHFYPFNSSYFSEAQFHVLANGFLLLHNFRIVESENLPVIKEFIIPVDSEKLKVTFVPLDNSKFAVVNAIEVISAPRDLVADLAQYVDSEKNEQISGLLKNGLETVHRVNVGGFKVTPFNDSFWRTWVTDDKYLKSGDVMEKIRFGGRINYQLGGASREVGPDNVYNTARVIKSSNGTIPNTNIKWVFEVEKGYRYMIRMHFCDIVSVATGMLYFNVYVNDNLAYENLDLSYITNRLLASPFYADFVVDEDNSGVLTVSVGPSNMSLPRAADAILNGIEVLKMNNSMGSFDGEVCTEFVLRSWRRGNAGVLVPLVAVIFLLLIASVFLQRRRNWFGDSVAWSRLPVDVSEVNLKCGNQFSSGKA